MSYKMLQVSDEIIFHTEGLEATILVEGEEYVKLGRDDLGAISEWLAAAWENVAGDEYKPVAITARGRVVDQGIPVSTTPEVGAPGSVPLYFGEGADRVLIGSAKLERDCE